MPDFKYECYQCHRKFRLKWTLQKHLSVHSDDRPYECWLCHKLWVKCVDCHINYVKSNWLKHFLSTDSSERHNWSPTSSSIQSSLIVKYVANCFAKRWGVTGTWWSAMAYKNGRTNHWKRVSDSFYDNWIAIVLSSHQNNFKLWCM